MPARVLNAIGEFLRLEAAAGLVLLGAAALAMIADNSPLSPFYNALLGTPVSVSVGTLAIHKPLLLWINDGLMAVFFLLVGLEIKREILDGELSEPSQIALPLMAAVGGMAAPAAIYAAINWGDPAALRGWAIPSATDIAFALGVLALLGPRVPISLKIFLATVAIIDDLGAIVIIALFYTANLSEMALALAALALAVLALLNWMGVTRVAAFAIVGVALWVCVLKSGVHATLAGVALAMAIPLRGADASGQSPLRRTEQALHPWVAFGIMPIFGFANAGVNLAGMTPGSLAEPVTLGIVLGLFVGKQIGILAAAGGMIGLGLARLPEGSNWAALYGVALLCGIGFTMSLFIGTLAFESAETLSSVRLGVLAGSLLSAAAGYAVLRLAYRD
jgi:Na+:H+ antiporter, NhaA family